jgi:hypothetical protein
MRQLINKRTGFLAAFSVLALALLIGMAIILAKKWGTIEPNFYSVKITDLAQFVITVLVAVFITCFIAHRNNLDLKQCEIMSGLIDELRHDIRDIFLLGKKYIQEKNKESEIQLRQQIQAASQLLSIVLELQKGCGLSGNRDFEKVCKKEFIGFKKALTDSPFGERGKYPEAQISKFYLKYHHLVRTLYSYKLSLYK